MNKSNVTLKLIKFYKEMTDESLTLLKANRRKMGNYERDDNRSGIIDFNSEKVKYHFHGLGCWFEYEK